MSAQKNAEEREQDQVPQRLTFTQKEKKDMEDCMRKYGFWYGSVPGSIIAGFFGYSMSVALFPKPTVRPITIVCASIGFLYGRFRQAMLCAMEVMPTKLNQYRQQKLYEEATKFDMQPEVQQSESPSPLEFGEPINTLDTYSSFGDGDTAMETDLSEPLNMKKQMTYDELRRKNRDDYRENLRKYTVSKNVQQPAQETPEPADEEDITETSVPAQKKNKYGDSWS